MSQVETSNINAIKTYQSDFKMKQKNKFNHIKKTNKHNKFNNSLNYNSFNDMINPSNKICRESNSLKTENNFYNSIKNESKINGKWESSFSRLKSENKNENKAPYNITSIGRNQIANNYSYSQYNNNIDNIVNKDKNNKKLYFGNSIKSNVANVDKFTNNDNQIEININDNKYEAKNNIRNDNKINFNNENEKIKEIEENIETIRTPNDKETIKNEENQYTEIHNAYENENNYNNYSSNSELACFFKSLDYDKYIKDVKIREALELIKIKVDQEEEDNKENNIDTDFKNCENLIESYFNKNEKLPITCKIENNSYLPIVTNNKISNNNYNKLPQLTNEQVESINKRNEFKQASDTLKSSDKLKQVHSINSIKKILEAQGLTHFNKKYSKHYFI